MDRLFETFTDGPSHHSGAGVFPLVNLKESKDNYYLRAELPGVNNSDLDLSVTDNTLTISGERKIPSETDAAKYHRREREAGKFSRAIALPGEIEAERVEASLVNGILNIVVPKAPKTKPRQITVN
jgi:HSP20 family protein